MRPVTLHSRFIKALDCRMKTKKAIDTKDGERQCHRRRTRRRQESRFGPADVTTSLASATRSDTCTLGTSYLNYHDLFLLPKLFSFHTFPSCERGEKVGRTLTYLRYITLRAWKYFKGFFFPFLVYRRERLMAGADKVLFVLMMMITEERFGWKRVDAFFFLSTW